ncbi:MAG: hypothetical protein AAF993_08300 [Pseudomonadota bacterium]
MKYRLDGAGVWSDSYDPADLGAGAHTVDVRQISGAGHASGVATLSFELVVVPTPVVTLLHDTGLNGSDGITTDASLSVDNIQQGATVQYRVDDAENWSDSYNPDDLAAGLHRVEVRQIDTARHFSESVSLSFELDNTLPPMTAQFRSGRL